MDRSTLSEARSRRRAGRVLRSITVVAVVVIALVAQNVPADAAFGPNIVMNGSFEDPVATGGAASPPFGACGASIAINGNGFSLSSSEGCWSAAAPAGSIYVDRAAAKGGKQSVVVAPPGQQLAWLTQAVPASAGRYRLQFKVSPEGTVEPITVAVWSLSATVVTQTSLVTMGPGGYVRNGSSVRTWTTSTLDIDAPAGTDHVVICLCGVSMVAPAFPISPGGTFPNGHWGSARFDAITLKQQL